MIDEVAAAIDVTGYSGHDVLVAVPDATRPLDLEVSLAPLLGALERAGCARVRVLVALGLHRPMTPDESRPLEAICARFGVEWSQHDAHAPNIRVLSPDVGLLPQTEHALALPASFHPWVVVASRIVALGTVEPHQYAGFSGGVKTLSIGCAGAETIGALHGLTYLRDEGTALGRVDGNPFRAALRRVAATLPHVDALQIVPGAPAEEAVAFGEATGAFERAASCAARHLFAPQPARVPWAALPVPALKATNLYQASRAASYVALVDRPAVEPGGWLVLEAACPEGMGEGAGERACEAALERGLDALVGELRGELARPLSGGEQRAYVIARVLETYSMALVGAPPIPTLERIGVPQFATLADAVGELGLDPSAGARWENVFHAVPIFEG